MRKNKNLNFQTLFMPVTCGCILLIFIVCSFLSGCKATMTDEERAAYIKSHTSEYKVLSVSQYMKPITNNFGGVRSYESRYYFTYIDEDGQVCEFENFEHTDYGLWKVCLGNENKYVIIDNGMDTYRYLYITEDTFKSISITAK